MATQCESCECLFPDFLQNRCHTKRKFWLATSSVERDFANLVVGLFWPTEACVNDSEVSRKKECFGNFWSLRAILLSNTKTSCVLGLLLLVPSSINLEVKQHHFEALPLHSPCHVAM